MSNTTIMSARDAQVKIETLEDRIRDLIDDVDDLVLDLEDADGEVELEGLDVYDLVSVLDEAKTQLDYANTEIEYAANLVGFSG